MKAAGRFMACFVLSASTLSCGPFRQGDHDEGTITAGDEFYGARDQLLSAGAFDITTIVHFYGGRSPFSLIKTRAGLTIVTADLLCYSSQPSEELRAWFILPDNTCVSLYAQKGNASRVTSIDIGERGKGFRPPPEALKPENLSAVVDPDQVPDGVPLEVLHDERDTASLIATLWARQTKETVDRIRIDEYSDPGTKGRTLKLGMPLRLASGILAAHGAEDISSDVAMIPTVEYERGKYPRTLPCQRLYILPGKTMLLVRATYDPLPKDQFTLERFTLGEPGVGYPGAAHLGEQKFTHPEAVDLRELVRIAGPLHYAAQIGDVKAIHELIGQDKGAIDARNREDSTPLHLAVKYGKRDVARIFLEAGADVDAGDSNGDTPLLLAAAQGRSDLISLLLEHGARTTVLNKQKSSVFLAAGRRGDIATVALLLDKHHADVNQADENGFTLLHRASDNSNTELVRLLLRHGANPNVCRSESISPLYEAISAGAVEVVRLLLEAGASVHLAKGHEWRPLDAVAQNGSVEIARMMIAGGAKPDGPALYAAANSGHAGVLKLFLDHGADLKYTDDLWKRTVLHTAHSAEVVKVLVQAGMDIEVKNKIGETPLHEAAHFAPHEVVVALLELGADPHAVSNWNKTPLQMAEERDRPEKAEILQTLRTAMSKVIPKKPPPDRK